MLTNLPLPKVKPNFPPESCMSSWSFEGGINITWDFLSYPLLQKWHFKSCLGLSDSLVSSWQARRSQLPWHRTKTSGKPSGIETPTQFKGSMAIQTTVPHSSFAKLSPPFLNNSFYNKFTYRFIQQFIPTYGNEFPQISTNSASFLGREACHKNGASTSWFSNCSNSGTSSGTLGPWPEAKEEWYSWWKKCCTSWYGESTTSSWRLVVYPHDLQGFMIHVRWLGMGFLPSTVVS